MMDLPNPIYSRRKRFLPEYRDLFAVLLKIPDEDVRDRVTQAINGIQNCPNCKIKQDKKLMDVGTQTEDSYFEIKNTDDIPETEDFQTNSKTNEVEKRRRKRKRNYPKVVKTSQHTSNVPVLKQEPNQLNSKNPSENEQPQKKMRLDPDDDAVSLFLENFGNSEINYDFEDIFSCNYQNSIETLKRQMAIEWNTCEQLNHAGFLPIHEAIVQNELPKLKRQLYVWRFRRRNIMDLFTEDNDNPLQLAVKENCMKSIIDELLKEDVDINDVDNDNNNIIHLAVSHLSNDNDMKQQKQILKILESLLNKIDLEILLQKNDDGLTPLHIAVKKNEFLMVEKILSVIDKRLNLKSVAGMDDSCADVKKFQLHYCGQCDRFDERETNYFKQKVLNATDMKRGCSVLFFAMELGYEHLVYLLLAHMCNPMAKNHAGSDPKTYFNEFGKNVSIASALENLSIFLQNSVANK